MTEAGHEEKRRALEEAERRIAVARRQLPNRWPPGLTDDWAEPYRQSGGVERLIAEELTKKLGQTP